MTTNTVSMSSRASVTRSDLLAVGFSHVQIAALERLQAEYPYIEFFDSRQELHRLQFMKWMIDRSPGESASSEPRLERSLSTRS